MPDFTISDTELWSSIQSGDARALESLLDRYWIRLYKTALKLTKDPELSKEIVHDVFLNIWERKEALVIESFPHFMLTAVRYQYYNRTRLAKAPVMLVDNYDKFNNTLTANEGEVRQIELELVNTIRGQILPLPKRCQEIFLMSKTEHLSNSEIADKLQISKRTVENQLSIALKYLRKVLKNNFLTVMEITTLMLSPLYL
ncbi:RNA polymerase sigma factor [Desertivirga arenae]|uniref:RNA polymerase sigma factor n=1 Tax=Desertivirga arenae TaxID=2810309 RepID=UPI001A975FF6|nr:sigma-70 family RNA polymerase sigma factor [Pedobacter sp. SYSU D00823]